MEFWRFLPENFRIKALGMKLVDQYASQEKLEKFWHVCERTFLKQPDESTKVLFYHHFLIMNVFMCDYACVFKLGDTYQEKQLHKEFYERVIYRINDLKLRESVIKTMELYIKSIRDIENDKQLHSKISDVFCALVDRAKDADLHSLVNYISFSIFHDVSLLLDELIKIGHLKIQK